MSGLRSKADIRVTHRHVRFGPTGDMSETKRSPNQTTVLDELIATIAQPS